MKKFRKLFIAIALFFGCIGTFQTSVIKIEAKTSYKNIYPMACSVYEVDTITDDGQFSKVQCYNGFSEAKAAMQAAGADAVVRHVESYAANKIIAMTRGYVYSYARRDNASVLGIYQNVAGDAKSTYINDYKGMYYRDTLDYDGSGDGTVSVNAFGFEGVVSLMDLDFVPEKFTERGLQITLGGNDATDEHEDPWQVTPMRTYYDAVQNGNYVDLVYHTFLSWPSNYMGDKGIEVALAVGPAPSFMEQGKKYYTIDDVNFYYDTGLTNHAGTYYNYYTYQSLRSRTNISGSTIDAFLEYQGYGSSSVLYGTGGDFIAAQNQYGINAAMVYAQACCEAAYGTSYFAVQRNNLFGVNAVDSNPNGASYFNSIRQCINQQMGMLLRCYTDTNNWLFFGGHFGNKGSGITVKYASSPYYGSTLASIYYRLDKFASNYDGNLVDGNSTCIGVVNASTVNVRSNPSLDSKILYTTEYGPTYQYQHTVTILGEIGDFYKIQSTDYIENGKAVSFSSNEYPSFEYIYDNMIGYIAKEYVDVVHGTVPPMDEPDDHNGDRVYRLYNPNSGDHHYTMSLIERNYLIQVGWNYENVAWYASDSEGLPLYRVYNPNSGDHHYTLYAAEKDWLVSLGWNDEGIAWFSPEEGDTVYRVYNPNSGDHHYTKNAAEKDWLVGLGWNDEGIAWYGVS